MSQDIVSICPRCSEKLIVTRLSCGACDLELNGNFPLSKFEYLSADELNFIEGFLKAQGNFKTVQINREMSYQAVKKKYNDILQKLDLAPIIIAEKDGKGMVTTTVQPINTTDSFVVRKIKEKLNATAGKTMIPLFNGDPCEIGFDVCGTGLVSSKIPVPNQLTWEVLEAAVEVVIQNGGRVAKGKARSGAKLGSNDLPLQSLEGYIAHKVHGVEIGKTAFGPGFVVAAILDWAEICSNERGYVTIKPSFTLESENVIIND